MRRVLLLNDSRVVVVHKEPILNEAEPEWSERGMCRECEGTGQIAFHPPENRCPACSGTGRIGTGTLAMTL